MILDSLLAYKNLKRSFYDDKSCMYLPMAKTSDLVRYLSANRVYSRRKCALKNAITQFSDKIIKKNVGRGGPVFILNNQRRPLHVNS